MILARTAVLSLALTTALAAGQPIETRGAVEAVTVFRGQAMVTRLVPLAAGAGGVREVVVTDLPERLIPASLHAEGGGDIQVRSVRYRERPLSQDVREEVRKIDERIGAIEREIAANTRKRELLNDSQAYVTSLQQFVAPTAQAELRSGVLDAEQLERLSAYILEQKTKAAQTDLDLANEALKLKGDLELARREKAKVTAGSSRTAREAVVFVSGVGGKDGQVRLRYLVDGASWTPSYNARAKAGDASSITLEYYASIQQMSGEDWGNVSMTLSTATPALAAAAPKLTAMGVSLAAPQQQAQQLGLADYGEARKELFRRQREAEVQRVNVVQDRSASSKTGAAQHDAGPGGGQIDVMLNERAAEVQLLDLLAPGKLTRDASRGLTQREEGVSVSYVIPGLTTLPSRNDRQLVQVASLSIPATFSKVALPVLTSAVYDEAACVNASELVLLEGPVTAYSNGAFVGGGDLPTVSAGQAFSLGFGADSSLKASRELLERTESIQGGNRVVDITYRLSIENFGATPASVQLLDRMPKTGDRQIKVTLVSSEEALSKDETYQRTGRKEGILRYDFTAPPRAIGASATTIDYTFRLEYDKQMTIVGMGQ